MSGKCLVKWLKPFFILGYCKQHYVYGRFHIVNSNPALCNTLDKRIASRSLAFDFLKVKLCSKLPNYFKAYW